MRTGRAGPEEQLLDDPAPVPVEPAALGDAAAQAERYDLLQDLGEADQVRRDGDGDRRDDDEDGDVPHSDARAAAARPARPARRRPA